MTAKQFKFLAFTCCLFLQGRCAEAIAGNDIVCPDRAIVVGVSRFGGFYQDGSGLDKDMKDEMAKRSGCRFELRVTTREGIWLGMQFGDIDMAFGAFSNKERLTFSYAFPYMQVRNYVVFNNKVSPDVHTPDEFLADPHLRMGVVKGITAGEYYDGFVDKLRSIGRVETVDSVERMFLMLKADRFQAIITDPIVFTRSLEDSSYRLEEWTPNGAKIVTNMLISKKNFSKSDSEKWGSLLQAITADGTVFQFLQHYVDKKVATDMLLR
jgi:polar amino acid transport system substrate-binding protein